MSTTPILEIEDLTVRPEGASADVLDRIDLVVGPAEVVAVLGSSGSGKTTLLRTIAGLESVASGRILIDGRDVDGVPAHRRAIGYMFQEHALFPHLDVRGNIEFGLRMQMVGRDERAARVEELLELVELAGAGERSVTTLSGGERQRVALARSLAPRPRLLLLDEPMGSLDRALREDLVVALGRVLRSLGISAIHVTHDHVEASAIADRIAVLDAGRIVAQGTLDAMATAPVDDHVARLLGRGRSLGD